MNNSKNMSNKSNQRKVTSTARYQSLNTYPVKSPSKLITLKTLLFVVLLSVLLLFVSGLVSILLRFTIGTVMTGFPLDQIFVLLLLPYGFDVILLTPLIWFLTNNFFNYFKITTSLSKIWMITISIMVLVIFLRTGLFRLESYLGENYIQHQVDKTMKQRDEIVGTEPAKFTYIKSHPTYSDTHTLENITVTLRAKLPKKGSYQVDGDLLAKNAIPGNPRRPDLYIPGRLKFSDEASPSEQEINIVFDAADLHKYNYEGQLSFSVYNIWRINVEIDAPFGGGTTDSAGVDFIGPGTLDIGPYPLNNL
jgi:hypothetical protein